jgi:hypothetical protein
MLFKKNTATQIASLKSAQVLYLNVPLFLPYDQQAYLLYVIRNVFCQRFPPGAVPHCPEAAPIPPQVVGQVLEIQLNIMTQVIILLMEH